MWVSAVALTQRHCQSEEGSVEEIQAGVAPSQPLLVSSDVLHRILDL
jgi:hypothetical protein